MQVSCCRALLGCAQQLKYFDRAALAFVSTVETVATE